MVRAKTTPGSTSLLWMHKKRLKNIKDNAKEFYKKIKLGTFSNNTSP